MLIQINELRRYTENDGAKGEHITVLLAEVLPSMTEYRVIEVAHEEGRPTTFDPGTPLEATFLDWVLPRRIESGEWQVLPTEGQA